MKSHLDILRNFELEVDQEKDPRKQVEMIVHFTIVYGDSYGEKILSLLERGILISQRIGFDAGEIICYYNMTFFGAMTKGVADDKKYLVNTLSQEELVEKLKADRFWYGLGLNILSYHYWFRGNYDKAFSTIFEGIRHSEESPDMNLAWQYFALAVFYFDTRDFESSQQYSEKAIEIFTAHNYDFGRARSMNCLASVYISRNEPQKAAPLLEYAAGVYRELGSYAGLSRALNDMGLIEKANKNYPKAIGLLSESIALRREIEHWQGLITSLTELGEIYLLMEDYDRTLAELEAALQYTRKVGSKQKEMRLCKLLYETYKKLGRVDLALENFETFFELRSQLMSDEATSNIRRLQSKFEKEKSEKETEIERLKNVELKRAYELIEQKNKDISDSIHYARRIQHSLMASEKYIDRTLERLMNAKPVKA